MDDAEVESQKGLNQEEVVPEAPQGDLPDSRPKGDKTPHKNLQWLRSRQAAPSQEGQAYDTGGLRPTGGTG